MGHSLFLLVLILPLLMATIWQSVNSANQSQQISAEMDSAGDQKQQPGNGNGEENGKEEKEKTTIWNASESAGEEDHRPSAAVVPRQNASAENGTGGFGVRSEEEEEREGEGASNEEDEEEEEQSAMDEEEEDDDEDEEDQKQEQPGGRQKPRGCIVDKGLIIENGVSRPANRKELRRVKSYLRSLRAYQRGHERSMRRMVDQMMATNPLQQLLDGPGSGDFPSLAHIHPPPPIKMPPQMPCLCKSNCHELLILDTEGL